MIVIALSIPNNNKKKPRERVCLSPQTRISTPCTQSLAAKSFGVVLRNTWTLSLWSIYQSTDKNLAADNSTTPECLALLGEFAKFHPSIIDPIHAKRFVNDDWQGHIAALPRGVAECAFERKLFWGALQRGLNVSQVAARPIDQSETEIDD